MEYLDHGKEYLYSKDGGHVKSCCTEKIILCPLQYGACLQYVHLIMKGHSGFVVLNGTQLKGIQLSSRRLFVPFVLSIKPAWFIVGNIICEYGIGIGVRLTFLRLAQ